MKKHWCCKLGLHSWTKVYLGKYNEWKIIAVYCWRCGRGQEGILYLDKKLDRDFGTYSIECYDKDGREV